MRSGPAGAQTGRSIYFVDHRLVANCIFGGRKVRAAPAYSVDKCFKLVLKGRPFSGDRFLMDDLAAGDGELVPAIGANWVDHMERGRRAANGNGPAEDDAGERGASQTSGLTIWKGEVGFHPAIDLRGNTAGPRGEDPRFRSGKKAKQIDGVAARVHERPASQLKVEADIPGVEHVGVQMSFQVLNLPKLSAGDDFLHPTSERMVALMECLGQNQARRISGGGHLARLFGVGGERFFAKDMLARRQSSQRPVAMQAIRQRDINRIDLG